MNRTAAFLERHRVLLAIAAALTLVVALAFAALPRFPCCLADDAFLPEPRREKADAGAWLPSQRPAQWRDKGGMTDPWTVDGVRWGLASASVPSGDPDLASYRFLTTTIDPTRVRTAAVGTYHVRRFFEHAFFVFTFSDDAGCRTTGTSTRALVVSAEPKRTAGRLNPLGDMLLGNLELFYLVQTWEDLKAFTQAVGHPQIRIWPLRLPDQTAVQALLVHTLEVAANRDTTVDRFALCSHNCATALLRIYAGAAPPYLANRVNEEWLGLIKATHPRDVVAGLQRAGAIVATEPATTLPFD